MVLQARVTLTAIHGNPFFLTLKVEKRETYSIVIYICSKLVLKGGGVARKMERLPNDKFEFPTFFKFKI